MAKVDKIGHALRWPPSTSSIERVSMQKKIRIALRELPRQHRANACVLNCGQFAKTLTISLLLAVALVPGLAGCTSPDAAVDTPSIAATVNGTEVPETAVSDSIATIRASYGYESDTDWAAYLNASGNTAESLRETVINYLAQNILVKQACAEAGITVDVAEIDSEIAEIRNSYGYIDDDEGWAKMLEDAGYTEEEFRSELEQSLLTEKLLDATIPATEPTEAVIQTFADSYAASNFSGKKSSHILFAADDQATAETILAELQASANLTEDFAAAVSQYSTDTGSAIDGGNVGWDFQNSFVAEYTDALATLEPGQLSGLVESQFGYHIILCTDAYAPVAGEAVDLTAMPADIYEQLLVDAGDEASYSAQMTWLEELVANADIVINPMPTGLPYDVDTTAAANPDASDGATGAGDAIASGAE
jgi:foldase protein PrsA